MIKRLLHRIVGSSAARKMVPKINRLPIAESGVDSAQDPFVRLDDGTIFYGHSSHHYNSVYRLIEPSVRTKLRKECLQVAVDVVIRYVEGGLKYGGPRKQSRYTVQPGDFVSEMGGYEGFCSIKLAQQVGADGKVVAIEPMRDNFRLLQKNRDANDLSQLIVENCAVWDSEKEVQFQRRKGDGQSSSIEMSYRNEDTYTVKAEPLDQIYERLRVQPVDFVIIQLNGAEVNALRGLKSFTPRHLSIAARYDTEGVDAAIAIKDLLEGRGYVVEIDDEDFVFASATNVSTKTHAGA